VLAVDLLTEASVVGFLSGAAATVLAKERFGEAWTEPLRDILSILEHDGYFRKDAAKYVFASGLLKDWWYRHLAFGYVPVSERGK
jgi:hypothetical protein